VLIPLQHVGLFDLVLFCDIIHDNIDVDLHILDIVDTNEAHTSGHSFTIIKQWCRSNARLNSFACQNVNAWNSMPESVVWCHLELHLSSLPS